MAAQAIVPKTLPGRVVPFQVLPGNRKQLQTEIENLAALRLHIQGLQNLYRKRARDLIARAVIGSRLNGSVTPVEALETDHGFVVEFSSEQ